MVFIQLDVCQVMIQTWGCESMFSLKTNIQSLFHVNGNEMTKMVDY